MRRALLEVVRPWGARAGMAAAALLLAWPGHAAIFEDGDARRAILELRQRFDAMQAQQQRSADELRRATDESAQLRRSLLELSSQIETLRAEQAQLRGQKEQLQREVAELQRRQKDMAQGVDERLRQFEPVKVTVDGQEFSADPAEKRDYEAALAQFRAGRMAEAAQAFAALLRQYPRSGYAPSSRFWLGNAHFANRDYKEAMVQFRAVLVETPQHARAPEAALSIASCQVELKDTRGARKTLEDLLKAYPQSEAAAAARERLARLK